MEHGAWSRGRRGSLTSTLARISRPPTVGSTRYCCSSWLASPGLTRIAAVSSTVAASAYAAVWGRTFSDGVGWEHQHFRLVSRQPPARPSLCCTPFSLLVGVSIVMERESVSRMTVSPMATPASPAARTDPA